MAVAERPNPRHRAVVVALLVLLTACGSGGGSSVASQPPRATSSSVSPVSPPAGTPIAASTTTAPAATTTLTVLDSISVATEPVALPEVDAAAYVVYDAGTQQWLAERQPDAALPVGSLMKLLTAYVVMQAGDPTHVATVPALQLDTAESAIGLYKGEKLPRDLLLRAMLIASANDAARTLALDVGGSESSFVAKMNEAAAVLGMNNTVAANPVGLDEVGERSSARDLVMLATILMGDATFRTTVARVDVRLHGQVFPNTNELLTTYQGATGVKTGHTTDAGYCLVGSATRDGRSLIVGVLGASSDKARLAGATALLDWAFSR